MNDRSWNCPHCRVNEYVPSATDEGVGVCANCRFAFSRRCESTDASTWRDQADLLESAAHPWPEVRPERYRIIRSLASGAQGHILLAHHRHLDQICVLKVIQVRDELRELATARLQTEARAGALVNHVNVARVLDCDSNNGLWYFAMEYVPGENLRRIVREVGRLCWEQVVTIAQQVADGLAAIHAADLIHRDIKPSNIMLGVDGTPKIMDLGLVKMPRSEMDMGLTHIGQVLGTPYYMAPEQFAGDETLTKQADLYSLGVTLFHLLAGRPPFQGTGVVELSQQHKRDPVLWPDEVSADTPAWIRHIVDICLAKRPEHRFASAAEVSKALSEGADIGAKLPAPGVTHQPRGILIVPFRNLSRRDEDDWIGDAIAEYIASRLLEVDGLHVVNAQGLARLVGSSAGDVRELDDDTLLAKARLLGAKAVLVGGYQYSGKQLRISSHSIEQNQGHTPSVTAHVAGSVDDLFKLEDELVETVLRAIGKDAADDARGSRSGADSDNLAAQEQFVRGKRAFSEGDYREAIRLAEAALAIDARCSGAASLIGAAHARMGDYDRAVAFHQQEELAARDAGDNRRLAEALGNLGVMYYYRGDYSLAHEFLEQARDLSRAQRQWGDCANYEGNLGFVAMRLERWTDAEEAFAGAIEVHKRYGDLVSLAAPYNGMGGVLLKQERFAEAREYYLRALGLATEIEDRVNVGVSHMNLGRCACLMESYAEAEACFDEALQALEGTNFWNGLTLVYEHMADMYLAEKNIDRAMRCIDQRIDLAQKHNNHRMEAEAWEQKAKAHELTGNKDEAFACLKRSIEVSQKPPPEESLHRHLSMIAKKQPFA